MKICKLKSGRILETQSSNDAAVMLKNQSQYFPLTELEIVDMTSAEYDKAIAIQNFNDLDYRQKRAREYPPAADYLDGIVKGDQTQVQKYINDCLAVKAKYPKT